MSDIDAPLYRQLTREIMPPSRKRSVGLTVLGTILVTLLINYAASWYLQSYPGNRGYWLVNQKWNMLQALEAPVDWLILGDSSGNQGVIPEVVVGDTAVSAINLATVANMTMVDDVWMLQIYIDQFGPPEKVVIVHAYDMWERNISHVFIAKASIPWADWNDLAPPLTLTFEDKSNIFTTRYVPIYAENKTLSNVIYNGVFGPDELFIKQYELAPGGNMPQLHPTPNIVLLDANTHIQHVSNRDFKMSNVNKAAIEQLILIAEANQLDVYLVNSPIYKGMFEDEGFNQYYGTVQGKIQSYTDQSEYVHFLDFTAPFTENEMENIDHVIHSAAIKYSEMIAEEIANTRVPK
ncbi:MAG: hypothetical protein GY943_15630 [Chloroflexi bacterium]|nr:hypothetical protein [Chloroflexota bacterium]